MFRELSEEEIDKFVEAVVNEYVEREKMKEEIVTLHLEKHLDTLANHLKTHRFLDSDILYQEEAFMDGKLFELLFESIMESAEEMKRMRVDEECEFPNKVCYLNYKDVNMTFFIMWGQGTCTQVYINDDEWNDQSSFTFDDLKQYQATAATVSKEESIR